MVRRIFRFLLKAAAWFIGLTLLFVLLFKWFPVPVTPLMVIRTVQQATAGKEIRMQHDWVGMKKISPQLQLAVIASEDQNFVNHWGFDLEAIDKAIKDSEKRNRKPRGASTISQQTAKNLFLWPGRSWVRKGLEVWFTGWIELLWSKKRILHVYLNIIEMGDGIYGAEAAARHFFGIPAEKLTSRQAATLAAVLPNPRRYNAASPGPYVSGRISWIQGQMQQYGSLELNPSRKNKNQKKK
ncbi:MAG TPA: monofunctional biosynthetic peptidoglycan transglycosylase [Prolixibacteraceae bacterium]|nr:monofunctional biosynthetic peptidoglycan transglycosylase [Prolixibacteraceae bacterium]